MSALWSDIRYILGLLAFALLAFLPFFCLAAIWPHPNNPEQPTTIRGTCANLSELAARYPAVARDLGGLSYEGPFRWTEVRGRGTPELYISGPIGLAAIRKWRNEPGQPLPYHLGSEDPEQRDLLGKEAIWFQLPAGERSYIMNVFVFPDGFTMLAVYGKPNMW